MSMATLMISTGQAQALAQHLTPAQRRHLPVSILPKPTPNAQPKKTAPAPKPSPPEQTKTQHPSAPSKRIKDVVKSARKHKTTVRRKPPKKATSIPPPTTKARTPSPSGSGDETDRPLVIDESREPTPADTTEPQTSGTEGDGFQKARKTARLPVTQQARGIASTSNKFLPLSDEDEAVPADHEFMTTTRDPDDEMEYSTDPPREDCAAGAPQRVPQRKRSAVTSASDDQHTSGTSDAGFKKPPPKKRAAPRQRTPVAPVSTANQYDALQDGADSEDPDGPPPAAADDASRRSGPKLPPIVIDYPDDYMTLRDWLQANLKDAFTAKHCGEDRLKLTVATTEDYVAVMDMVGARGIPNYTFPTVRPKVLKVAMRGIPLKMKADAFKDGLITMGFAPTAATRMKMPGTQRPIPLMEIPSRSDGPQQRRRAAPPPAPPLTPPRQPAQRRLLAARADLGYADVLQGQTTPPSAPAVPPPRHSEDGPAPPAAAADFIAVLKEVQATLVAVSAALAQLPTAITAAVHAALRSFPTATAFASTGHGSQP
ncbi:proteoglycan 4-like [Schistocerca nitens]|uniref:proteoglycan 4-like n=1 Tax=Schistocerca nitens TaxID=7011 RepID=UPI002118EEA1|nr:proteoglycan 4-like [Schistocerca nitens]